MATIQDGCDRRNREAGKLERMAPHGQGKRWRRRFHDSSGREVRAFDKGRRAVVLDK
jgi:hypothetical protein